MAENPLISLGQLTKPINTLVERSSDAVGGLFRPWQIRRVARAEAEAEIIRAEQEIEVTELHNRAFWRFLQEEGAKQTNMENILVKAIPNVDQENARPEDITNDWLSNFFDKCRIVSDEDMQSLWARIIAGEANNPGSFSRLTVNLMASMDNRVAQDFVNLCKFRWVFRQTSLPLVYEPTHQIYTASGINFGILANLDNFGLIRFDPLPGFTMNQQPRNISLSYCGRSLILKLLENDNNSFQIGTVILTRAGSELSTLCEASPVDGFVEFVTARWVGEGYSVIPIQQ